MSGGPVEMMLLNAAIGGGVSAATGGDPLKGALLGGITGGITGGFGGTAAPAAQAGSQMGQAVVAGGIPPIDPTALAKDIGAAQTLSAPGATSFSAMGDVVPTGSLSAQFADPTGLAQTQLAASPSAATRGGDMFSGLKDWYGSLSKGQQLGVLGAGGVGAMMLGERMMAPKAPSGAYEGPLKKFRFDIAGYRPSMMADGGIASLRGADITVGGGMPRANPMGGADSGMLDWQQRSTPTTYMASGGISDLGSYSDGGRMLRGPGDGMSDNIPGVIGGKQPARLADGEFVVPADVVSHLGNGSTDAGAKQLYNMMDRVRKARTGTKKQGRQINPMRQMPA